MNKVLRQIVPADIAAVAKTGAYHLYHLSNRFFSGPFDKYDFQTIDAIKKILKPSSSWIDIGAHKGHILKELLKVAPNGRSYAFEPIPGLFKKLQKKYGKKVTVLDLALSDKKGELEFVHVIDRPAISGFIKRTFDETYTDEKIKVQVERLDNIIPEDVIIELIKIDVEGAEMQVLKGAERILRRDKPVLLFEFGLGGADLYNTTPEMMYDYLESCGYSLSILEYYLNNKRPFNRAEFIGQFEKVYNYFFIAYPS